MARGAAAGCPGGLSSKGGGWTVGAILVHVRPELTSVCNRGTSAVSMLLCEHDLRLQALMTSGCRQYRGNILALLGMETAPQRRVFTRFP